MVLVCTNGFERERRGVCLDAGGRLVRSLNTALVTGLDAELDRIQPVGLVELVEGVLVALCAAGCLDTMLL